MNFDDSFLEIHTLDVFLISKLDKSNPQPGTKQWQTTGVRNYVKARPIRLFFFNSKDEIRASNNGLFEKKVSKKVKEKMHKKVKMT